MHTQVGELHVHHGGGWAQENDYTVHEGSLEEKTETRRSSSKLRTSDDFRTSDVSDVRQPTDVRTHDREIANASDIRQTSDVRRLGRPKPDGRPTSQLQLGQDPCSKTSALRLSDVRSTTDVRPIFRTSETQRTSEPACVQFRALCHVSPSSPLDYKYPFTTSFLGLAKIISRFVRA